MGCRPSKTSATGSQDQTGSVKHKTADGQRNVVQDKRNVPISSNKLVEELPTDESDVLDQFPDPTKVPIVDYIPKKQRQFIKVEDTFWSKKKALIPDYSVMDRIDSYALKAPDSLRTSPEKLVTYLLKPCKTEVEKVRVLIRWIGDNIAYDVAGREDLSNADVTVEGVLRNKRAICEGYATVVQMFCQLADIESEKISGQTKNGEHIEKEIRTVPKSDHAWNRIKIKGDWYLVDSTWCAGSVGDKVFTKKWNEWWFLTDPEAFIETHLPMARDKTLLIEQQMVQQPYHSSEEWDTKVERNPAAFTFGIEPLTHLERRFTTKQNEIIIKFKCKENLSHFANIYVINGNIQAKVNSSWYIMYEVEGIIFTHVRFQKKGVYHLKFGAEVISGNDIIKHPLKGLMYRITADCKGASPYPQAQSGKLGLQADFYDSGFQLLYPKSPVISTTTGFTAITVKLPTTGILSNIVKLYGKATNHSEDKNEFRGLVYGEKKGDIAKYYIQCPEKGEYKLGISAKYQIGEHYYQAITLLISCTGVNSPVYHHPADGSLTTRLGGPDPHFYNVGLTTNQRSSTVTFVDDMAVLVLKMSKPVVLSVKLKSVCEVATEELIKKDEDKEQLKITVTRPNVPGYYWLVVYAKEKNKEGGMPFAGAFCLPNKVPFHNMN